MDKGLKKLLISIVISLSIFIFLIILVKLNIISFNINILTNTEQQKYFKNVLNIKTSFVEYIDVKKTKIKLGLINNIFINNFLQYKNSNELSLLTKTFLDNNPDIIAVTYIDKNGKVFFTQPHNPDLVNKTINSVNLSEYLKHSFLLDNLLSNFEEYSKIASIIIPYPIYNVKDNTFAGLILFHIHGSSIAKEIKERSSIDINSIIYQLGNNVIIFSPYSEILEDKKELSRIINTISKENKLGFMGPSKEFKASKGTYYIFYDATPTELNYKFGLITIKIQTNKLQLFLVIVYAISIISLIIYILLVTFSFSEKEFARNITHPKTQRYSRKEEDEFLSSVSQKSFSENYFQEGVSDKLSFSTVKTKEDKKEELKSLIKDISKKESEKELKPKEVPSDFDSFDIELPSLAEDEKILKSEENIELPSLEEETEEKPLGTKEAFEEEIELPSLEEQTLEEQPLEEKAFEEPSLEVQSDEELELPKLDEETLSSFDQEPVEEIKTGETKEEFQIPQLEEETPSTEEIELPSLEEEPLTTEEVSEENIELPSLEEETEEKPLGTKEAFEEEIELPSLEEQTLEEQTSGEPSLELQAEEELELPKLDEETLSSFDQEAVEEIKTGETKEEFQIPQLEEETPSTEEIELPSLEEEPLTTEGFTEEVSEENIELPSLEEETKEPALETKETFEEEIELPSLEEQTLEEQPLEEQPLEEKAFEETSLETQAEEELELPKLDEENIEDKEIALSDKEISDIFQDAETKQVSPFDQISKEYSINFKIDYVLILKNDENNFVTIGSSKENLNLNFDFDEPLIQKLIELKKDIYIPQGIYKFKPLLDKNEEFFSEIDGIYLKPKFEGSKLANIVCFFLKKGKNYDKEVLLNIANKISALI